IPAIGTQQLIKFEYDWKGRRIRKRVYSDVAGSTLARDTIFVYDGWNLVAELDTSHSPLRTYMWGLDLSGSLQGAGGVGGLLAISDSSTINSQASTHFVSYDGNGNVSALVNGNDGT